MTGLIARLRTMSATGWHPIGDEAADEIDRLNQCLQYEQHRAERVGTHWPDCYSGGPQHYECALREIDRLTRELAEARAELERERMRLVACGVVAMSNTSESAARNREMHADYRSASCDDVARAVDREMALRAERNALAKQGETFRRLVDACKLLSSEAEEYEFDDGIGRGAMLDYWYEFDRKLDAALAQIEQERSEQKEGA